MKLSQSITKLLYRLWITFYSLKVIKQRSAKSGIKKEKMDSKNNRYEKKSRRMEKRRKTEKSKLLLKQAKTYIMGKTFN